MQEYCTSWNATEAAKKAGYAHESASVEGHRLLTFAEVQRAVKKRQAELAEVAALDAVFVLNQWRQIATANPNDITQLRRSCCRACWGVDHHYQWTESEFTKTMALALDGKGDAPINAGGFGYDPNRVPNSDCPECQGLGTEWIYNADTRKLKGSAKVLYAGAQQTKEGVKILLRDQDRALDNIAKYLGMFANKGDDGAGGAVPAANIPSGLGHFYGDVSIFNVQPGEKSKADGGGDGEPSSN